VSFAGTGWKLVEFGARADSASVLYETPSGPRDSGVVLFGGDDVDLTVCDDHGVMGWEGRGDPVAALERVDESVPRETYAPREPVFLT